jgi:UDP-N-acetyl-D-mannosaminuronate dehydrogenase
VGPVLILGDTRETASVFVCRDLLAERAQLFVFDPQVERDQMFLELEVSLSQDNTDEKRHDPHTSHDEA